MSWIETPLAISSSGGRGLFRNVSNCVYTVELNCIPKMRLNSNEYRRYVGSIVMFASFCDSVAEMLVTREAMKSSGGQKSMSLFNMMSS